MSKGQKYDESNIKAHIGLDGVRARPSMYIGELGNHAIFHLVKEAVDNCVDEYFAGRNTTCEVVAKDNLFVVHDESGGIPVGTNKELGISTLTAVFTHLHAGGKFDNSAFKVSAGTHGVGNKAITALSTRLEVWTFRDGAWYYQKFSQGKVVTKVEKKKPSAEVAGLLPRTPKKGTILLWEPDLAILGKNAKLVTKDLITYLEGLAFLNKGFKVTFKYWEKATEKVAEYFNKVGPAYFVTNALEKRKLTADGRPLVIESEHFDCAVQLTDYEDGDGISAYVNSSLTVDGGKHLDGFWTAFNKALQPYANRNHSYTPRDLRFGLIGFINLRVSGPKFSSQTKEKLVGFAIDAKGQKTGQIGEDLQLELEKPEVAIERYIMPWLNNEFKKNKSFPKAILDRATSVAKARDQSKELMKAASKLKVKDKHDPLPDVLYTATKAGPEQRELFVVEGDSAGGCHSGDTEVLLADGTKKTFIQLVEDFKNGIDNYGIAFNLTKGEPTKFKLYHPRITKYVTEMCEIVFDNGVVWRGTPDHPWLLTNGKYKRADELGPDDVIQEVPNPSDASDLLDSEP